MTRALDCNSCKSSPFDLVALFFFLLEEVSYQKSNTYGIYEAPDQIFCCHLGFFIIQTFLETDAKKAKHSSIMGQNGSIAGTGAPAIQVDMMKNCFS